MQRKREGNITLGRRNTVLHIAEKQNTAQGHKVTITQSAMKRQRKLNWNKLKGVYRSAVRSRS